MQYLMYFHYGFFLCVFAENVHFIPARRQLLSFVGNSQLCIAVTTIDSGTIGPVQFSVRIDNFVNPFLPPPNPLNVFEPNTVTVVIEEGEHNCIMFAKKRHM